MHPAVSMVIRVAARRWRRAFAAPRTWRELGGLRETLAPRAYDAVIDTQGLIKSALITRLAPGRRYGLDWASAREPLWPFYDQTLSVSWSVHAVERNRQLVARALGYALPAQVDYGIARPPLPSLDGLQPGAYAVLLHATSASAKLWGEDRWVELGQRLRSRGLQLALPWGSELERRRSDSLAQRLQDAIVPPSLSLREAAGLLGHARVVFGVDTGLTHLSVALRTPTVGIYCATDPAATGLYGSGSAVSVGGKKRAPSAQAVIAAWRDSPPTQGRTPT
jgi:heptosyltransferase-1